MNSDQGCNVLLVENDADVRVMLTIAMEVSGYRVTPVQDAEQAMKCLRQAKEVDIVLTDYGLPSMQGDTLIRRLRTLPRPVPSILMSVRDDFKQIAQACKADAAFRKGNSIFELVSILRSLTPIGARR